MMIHLSEVGERRHPSGPQLGRGTKKKSVTEREQWRSLDAFELHQSKQEDNWGSKQSWLELEGTAWAGSCACCSLGILCLSRHAAASEAQRREAAWESSPVYDALPVPACCC